MLAAHTEASSVSHPSGSMYVIGGLTEGVRTSAVEILPNEGNQWEQATPLEEPRSRACASASHDTSMAYYIMGGATDAANATADIKWLSAINHVWHSGSPMAQPRKDHACLLVELDGIVGFLVTGGVDADDNVLNSAEFYNIAADQWRSMRRLRVGRTEHGEDTRGNKSKLLLLVKENGGKP